MNVEFNAASYFVVTTLFAFAIVFRLKTFLLIVPSSVLRHKIVSHRRVNFRLAEV